MPTHPMTYLQDPRERMLGTLGSTIGNVASQGYENKLLQDALSGIDVNDPNSVSDVLNRASPMLLPKLNELLKGCADYNKNTDFQLFQKRKENRLVRQDIGNRYQRIIKDVQDNVNHGLINRADGKKIIGNLRKEENTNYENLGKNVALEDSAMKDYFKSFVEPQEATKEGFMSRVASLFSGDKAQQQPQQPNQQQSIQPSMQPAPVQQPTAPAQKTKFDPNNPEHRNALDEALRQTGGDEEAANKILARTFKK